MILRFPNEVTTVDHETVMSQCGNKPLIVKGVVFHAGIATVQHSAFSGFKKLKSIKFEGNTVCHNAFQYCENITEITAPAQMNLSMLLNSYGAKFRTREKGNKVILISTPPALINGRMHRFRNRFPLETQYFLTVLLCHQRLKSMTNILSLPVEMILYIFDMTRINMRTFQQARANNLTPSLNKRKLNLLAESYSAGLMSEYKSMVFRQRIAILVARNNLQETRNNSLEARNNLQETRNNSLEALINSLKARISSLRALKPHSTPP